MTSYLTILGSYLLVCIEYVVFSILAMFQMDRRHNFGIRAFACISVGLSSATLFSYLEFLVSSNFASYIYISYQAVMLLMVFVSSFFLISASNSIRIFISTIIFFGENSTIVFKGFALSLLTLNDIAVDYYFPWIVEAVFFVISAAFIYFLFIKNFYVKTQPVNFRNIPLYSLLFIIISFVFFSSGAVISVKASQYTMFLYMLDFFYLVIMEAFFFFMMKQEENDTMLGIIRQMWNEDRKQYQIQKESMDIINIKCHDLRHQIQDYRQSSDSGGKAVDKMMAQLEKNIYIYDAVIKTGNEVLDVILSNISLRCQKKNVQLTCMVDGKELLFMDDADIYSLFGNMLDNALEYEEKVGDKTKRFISLTLKKVENFAHVHCENYYKDDADHHKKKGFLTTKKDTINHGFGIKSMEQIVDKYQGQFDIIMADDMFQVDIMIPLKDKRV